MHVLWVPAPVTEEVLAAAPSGPSRCRLAADGLHKRQHCDQATRCGHATICAMPHPIPVMYFHEVTR